MYVSRAGAKLEFALDKFKIDIKNKICADLGCSTGGFTDCLLQHGAAQVYSVDTGYGVLDWKLRQDPRVVVKERSNALHITFPELIEFISIDVSWTRQHLIVPHALSLLTETGDIVSLLKPHYEAPKNLLHHGRVNSADVHQIINQVESQLSNLNIHILNIVESPVKGEKGGNTEFLLHIKKLTL